MKLNILIIMKDKEKVMVFTVMWFEGDDGK